MWPKTHNQNLLTILYLLHPWSALVWPYMPVNAFSNKQWKGQNEGLHSAGNINNEQLQPVPDGDPSAQLGHRIATTEPRAGGRQEGATAGWPWTEEPRVWHRGIT